MPPALRHHLRWLGPVLVLAVAALLRFWALGRPDSLVFDELYYVRDAISQLAHGFPTTWPDSDPDMSGARATAFTDEASYAVHPPLGKWLLGLGILAFGPETGWGWRSAVALTGVATVGVTMRLGYLLSRSMLLACTAGLLLAIDGVHVVLTRVALLDGFLTFFIALGALFIWKDIEGSRASPAIHPGPRAQTEMNVQADEDPSVPPPERSFPPERTPRQEPGRMPIVWRRPWLLAAGLAFGAAAAVKWSGLYPLAFFLIFITYRDLALRVRERSSHPLPRAVLQAFAAALIALPAAAAVYIASWAGWILNPNAYGRTPGEPWPVSLARYHGDMLAWHSTLNAEHPYMANPLTWPLALKPTAMYESRWTDGCPWGECVSGISALPNPLVTWAGVAALVVLAVLAIRRTGRTPVDPLALAGAFVAIGYLANWLPWVLTYTRPSVFQFYAVTLTPFSALALALMLGMLCGVPIRSRADSGADPLASVAAPLPLDPASLEARRIAVAIFLAFAVALAALFFPVWSGTPVADWFWQAHLWLPDWH